MNPWARWLQTNGPGRLQLAYKGGWDAFVNAARRSDLEVLTRAEMARLDADSLEDYNEARLVWNANLPTVKTHQLAAAFAVIDQVMASNRRDADRLRGSVVVDAAPAVGVVTRLSRRLAFGALQARVADRQGSALVTGLWTRVVWDRLQCKGRIRVAALETDHIALCRVA